MLKKYTLHEIESAAEEAAKSGNYDAAKKLADEARQRRVNFLRYGENVDEVEEHYFGNKVIAWGAVAFLIACFLFLTNGYVPCLDVPFGRSRNTRHECSVEGWQLELYVYLLVMLMSAVVVISAVLIRRHRINRLKNLTSASSEGQTFR